MASDSVTPACGATAWSSDSFLGVAISVGLAGVSSPEDCVLDLLGIDVVAKPRAGFEVFLVFFLGAIASAVYDCSGKYKTNCSEEGG